MTLGSMPAPLIEFPADDPDRARRFWHGVLGVALVPRPVAAGSGWQTETDDLRLGVHERGRGPGAASQAQSKCNQCRSPPSGPKRRDVYGALEPPTTVMAYAAPTKS